MKTDDGKEYGSWICKKKNMEPLQDALRQAGYAAKWLPAVQTWLDMWMQWAQPRSKTLKIKKEKKNLPTKSSAT